MKITQHPADEEGNIYIQNVLRLLTMGLRNNVPTLWAVTDPAKATGIPLKFHVKTDNDSVSTEEAQDYITSFINDDGVWHLFAVKPKIQPMPQQSMPPQRGPRSPEGKILA